MVTLLDAHPSIAMSYEQYPSLLKDKDGKNCSKNDLLRFFVGRKSRGSGGVQTFMDRAIRGGLSSEEMHEIVRGFKRDDFDSRFDERAQMEFVGAIARAKMLKEGKIVWGLKSTNSYAAYAETYPSARFINITRDGRDVAASQMNTGAFNKTVTEIAKGWKATHLKFTSYALMNPDTTFQVFYEGLAVDPEPVLREVCDFLGEAWDHGLLRHMEKDLTIFNARHLSGERLKVPIDGSKIGRWKKDLNAKDIKEFEREAGDLLEELGYI